MSNNLKHNILFLLLLFVLLLSGCQNNTTSTPSKLDTYLGTIAEIDSSVIHIETEQGTYMYASNNPKEYTRKSKVIITVDEEGVIHSIEVIDPYDIEDYIDDMLHTMSIEEKVGQLFLVRYNSDNYDKQLTTYRVGGIIFFAKDYIQETKESVALRSKNLQELSEIPLLLAVDEEGGSVNRISLYNAFRAVPFWSSQDLYEEGGWKLIDSDTQEKCDLLRQLGINVNMAPVVDVSTNPNDYMYKRSFGKEASATSDYATHVVRVMKQNSIGSVLKHFPGYGSNSDTHKGIAIDNRSYEEFVRNDFLPFIAGIEAGADAVLVSHNIVTCIDDVPASLSSKMHEILRNDLQFDGVIITDDLFMNAIKEYTDNESAAVDAIVAGNDILCCTDYEEQIPAVLQAVANGTISEERINESIRRILRWKFSIGLIEL